MVAYSQQTTLKGGNFAPSVQYNTSVRMPERPLPELKQPDSKFNIDLSDLSKAMQITSTNEMRLKMFEAEQNRLANKEAAEAAEKERKESLKRNFFLEASKIQQGLDQDVYGTEAAELKMRQLQDKYVGVFGMDPDEMSQITNYTIGEDVRGVHSRKRTALQNAQNQVDAELVTKGLQMMPSMAGESPEKIVTYMRHVDKVGTDLVSAIQYAESSGNPEAWNTVDTLATELGDIQGLSTYINAAKSKNISPETGTLFIHNSVLNAELKKGVPADMARSKAEMISNKYKTLADMHAKANAADQKLLADNIAHVKNIQVAGAWNNGDETFRNKMALGLITEFDAVDTSPKINYTDTVDSSIGLDGKITYKPVSIPTSVTDVWGRTVAVDNGNVEQAIKELNNANTVSIPLANHYNRENIGIVYSSSSVGVEGKDLTSMSDVDSTTLVSNRKGVDAVVNRASITQTATNVGDTSMQPTLDRQRAITSGVEYIANNKDLVKSLDISSNMRKMLGSPVMIENTRITDEGLLIATTDVPGFFGTMGQYMQGADYRRAMQNANQGLLQLPVPVRKPVATALAASVGLNIQPYNPEVDGEMTSEITTGEAASEKVMEGLGAAWGITYKGLKKFDEKVFTPLEKQIQEIITPYLDEAINNYDKVFEDLKGGKGSYAEHIKNNVKEAVSDFSQYITNAIDTYKKGKAIESGANATGLANIVNRSKAAEDFLNYIRDTSEKLNEITPENMPSAINSIVQTEPVVPATGDPLDLNTYPLQKNEDGSVSNIKTEIVGRKVDGKEVEFIVPTMGDTSKHFGGFATVEDAEAADKELHEKLDIKIAAEGVNKHKQFVDDFIDGAEEAIKDVAGKYTDDMSTVLEPAVSTIEGFKAGFQAGETVFKDDEKAYSIFVQAVNEAGKKRFGLIRQILLSMPFSAGYVAGQLKDLVPFIIHLAEGQGIELDRPEAERIAKVSQELYKDMYRKSVVDNSKTAKRKRYEEFETKFKNGTPYKRAYYGVKETDELNQALMEPFLND